MKKKSPIMREEISKKMEEMSEEEDNIMLVDPMFE